MHEALAREAAEQWNCFVPQCHHEDDRVVVETLEPDPTGRISRVKVHVRKASNMKSSRGTRSGDALPTQTARAMWEVLEPYHAVTYFAPEARAAADAVGLIGGWMVYFASRAAPLGPVPAEVVIATFYNFQPAMVQRAIPDAWRRAAPADVLEARLAGVDAALQRLLGDAVTSAELSEAAALAREAATACDPYGRPLFAANDSLPWPEAPHLVLWTAATRLREHRDDGHVAALLTAGIDPCEAHVTLAGLSPVLPSDQRRYRGWSEEDWGAAVARLRRRGWLRGDGALSAAGRRARTAVERITDELAAPPWQHLGPERSLRLWRLMRGLSGQIIDGGGIPVPNPMGLPWPPAPPPAQAA